MDTCSALGMIRFLWISRNVFSNLSRFMGFKIFFKTSASLFRRNFLVQENDYLYVPSFSLYHIRMEYLWKRVNKIFSLFSHLPYPSAAARYATCLKVEMYVYPRCLLDAYLVRTWCVISPIPLNVLSILLVLLFVFL